MIWLILFPVFLGVAVFQRYLELRYLIRKSGGRLTW